MKIPVQANDSSIWANEQLSKKLLYLPRESYGTILNVLYVITNCATVHTYTIDTQTGCLQIFTLNFIRFSYNNYTRSFENNSAKRCSTMAICVTTFVNNVSPLMTSFLKNQIFQKIVSFLGYLHIYGRGCFCYIFTM